MSKALIDEAIKEWGDVPNICHKQIECQKNYYHRLINAMDEYDWDDLFTTGVRIKEKDGDPQTFINHLTKPVKLFLFLPVQDGNPMIVKRSVIRPLLEQKLLSHDIYMGPIGQQIQNEKGEEFTTPYRYLVLKEERLVMLSCI